MNKNYASIFAVLTDAQIAHAVRSADLNYQRAGLDPYGQAVSLSILRDLAASAPTPNPPSPPIDGCTESNCPRCRTHPAHRGDMEHAGIGDRPSAVEARDAQRDIGAEPMESVSTVNGVEELAFAEAMAISKEMFRAGFRSGMSVSAASQAGKLPLPGEATAHAVSEAMIDRVMPDQSDTYPGCPLCDYTGAWNASMTATEQRKVVRELLEKALAGENSRRDKALETLKSVLCDPSGDVASGGSDADRMLIAGALDALTQPVVAENPAADAVTAAPYSLDADPQGIRERVAAAITGALAFGSQGNNAPPAGHWLQPFWDMARAEAELRTPAAPGIDLADLADTWVRSNPDPKMTVRQALNMCARSLRDALIDASHNGELESWKRGTKACAEVLGQVTRQLADSSKGGSEAQSGELRVWGTYKPGMMPKLFGDRDIAELNWYPEEGSDLICLQIVERVQAQPSDAEVKA